MNQFIIATHATLAGGFAVVRFFKSDLENVQFINAYVESQEFEKEFRTALEKVKGENVIVLSDIMGGSVNQVATRLMQEFSYQLITGINLPLLIELTFMPDGTAEQIRNSVVNAREQIVYVNDFVRQEEAGGEEEL